MSLPDWVKHGWLKEQAPTREAVVELLSVARRDLHDAQTQGLSVDWRFGIAYNAGLQLARAALLSAGYETLKGDSHHFRAIDSLQHTIGLDGDTVDLFQTFRRKRSTSIYDAIGMVSEADAAEMLALARELDAWVRDFVREIHPGWV